MLSTLKITIKTIILINFFISPKLLAREVLEFSPYIGIDVQKRYTCFKKFFGDDLFSKSSPQGNAYFGCKLNRFFGIELGYQTTGKKDRDVWVKEGTNHLGQPANDNWSGIGSKQIQGWNFNLIGFIPFSDKYGLDLIGILGISDLKLKLKDMRVTNAKTVYHQIVFNRRKTIARIGMGTQKIFNDQFITRVTVIFENTEKFNNLKKPSFDNSTTYTIKLRNSVIYGLGVGIIF